MVQFLINEPHPHPCPQSELPVHLVTFLQMPSQNVNIWAGSFELSPLPSNPIPTLTLSQLHLLFYGENKNHRKRNTSTSSPYFLISKGVWIIALFFSTSEGEVVLLLPMVKPPPPCAQDHISSKSSQSLLHQLWPPFPSSVCTFSCATHSWQVSLSLLKRIVIPLTLSFPTFIGDLKGLFYT